MATKVFDVLLVVEYMHAPRFLALFLVRARPFRRKLQRKTALAAGVNDADPVPVHRAYSF